MLNENADWIPRLLPRGMTIGAAVCLLSFPSCAEELSDRQARLGAVTGDVGLLTQGALEWIEPHEGLPLEPGDHIRTGEDGTAELVTGEHVLWSLAPQSEIVTEHMENHSGHMNLLTGEMHGILDSGKLAGIAQSWTINTPAAAVAIRGTEFFLTFSKTEGTHLGVLEGMVEMQPAETAAGSLPPVSVSRGQEAVAERGKNIQKLTAFSPPMKKRALERQTYKKRLRVVQNTWSPFTPTVRQEARLKYVSPLPKKKAIRKIPPRKRRRQQI